MGGRSDSINGRPDIVELIYVLSCVVHCSSRTIEKVL